MEPTNNPTSQPPNPTQPNVIVNSPAFFTIRKLVIFFGILLLLTLAGFAGLFFYKTYLSNSQAVVIRQSPAQTTQQPQTTTIPTKTDSLDQDLQTITTPDINSNMSTVDQDLQKL